MRTVLLHLKLKRAVLKLFKDSFLHLFISLFFLLLSCSTESTAKPVDYSYVIVDEYPHDPNAFTQGLAWDNGIVYEGTGLYGKSSLRQVDLQTGTVIRRIENDSNLFGEGVTVFKDRIYQLTWKNKVILHYNKHDFSLIASYSYPREGWGITHDSESIIVSDGTAVLHFLDPYTLVEKKSVTVHDNSANIAFLNELEYIDGKIWANIWKSDRIAIINPVNGEVDGWLDLTGLRDRMDTDKKLDVLNGIMYNQAAKKLYVTGKLWPILFEIKLVRETN